MLSEGGVPRKFHQVRLSEYKYRSENFESYKKVELYISDLPKRVVAGEGLHFFGGVGTGKTFLLCCVLREAARQGISLCFRQLSSMLSELADHEFGNTTRDTVRGFYEAKILALDNVDEVMKSKSGISGILFDRIIRYRYNEGLPVLISSTAAPKQLEEVHGKGVASLFSSTLESVPLMGSDYRARKVK